MKNYSLAVLTTVVMLGCVQTAFAQQESKLAKIAIDEPECLIKPKGYSCNVRKTPNPKAQKVADLWEMTAANDFNAQWYKTNEGYVSKTAAIKVTPKPITPEMLLPNHYYDEVDYEEWSKWWLLDDVGSYHLALYYLMPDHMLYLGKRIGNIVVLKYSIVLTINHSDTPNTITLHRETSDGEMRYMLTVGDNYYAKGDKRKYVNEVLDDPVTNISPKVFNDKTLLKLFGEVIDEGPNANMYLTGENFPENLRNQVQYK